MKQDKRRIPKYGPFSSHWKGGRRQASTGYIDISCPGHPRARGSGGYVGEHILIVERVLGKFLPPPAEVHHVNGDRTDNHHGNLVACENHAYHHLLEVRTRAFRACGHADWRKCNICKQWDDPNNLTLIRRRDARRRHQQTRDAYHKACVRERVA